MQDVRPTQKQVPNEQLRWERQKRGWSRAYIAEQIGVADPKTIGRWERGSSFPSAHFLQKLCELFQMPPAKLGLWPAGQPRTFVRSEAELRGWHAGSEMKEPSGELARALPVRVGTRTMLLLIDDPWAFAEQTVDGIPER